MQTFTKQVISIVKEIPMGCVMTYGQIAKLAGSPRSARQVARILHTMSRKYDLPWHRVVNADGKIVIQDEESAFQQQILLENEGVIVQANGKIDLQKFLAKVR